jgi:Na+/melibiose symporter-like transporter
MGALGAMHLLMFLAVGIIAAICGFFASASRRNKRRAHGFFLLGFVCGCLACAILWRRRPSLNALEPVVRYANVQRLGAAIPRGT